MRGIVTAADVQYNEPKGNEEETETLLLSPDLQFCLNRWRWSGHLGEMMGSLDIHAE
jgi:hypothetical protein